MRHLARVLVGPKVVEAFEHGSGTFKHGFTYQAHPVATAAGNAVLDYIESHNLFARVVPAAETLRSQLLLRCFPIATSATSAGLGLLVGIEFVRDKSSANAV